MNTLNFNYVFLGQSVLKYEVPLDIYFTINNIYEKNFHKLKFANKALVGKIKNEHVLFYDGEDESKMSKENLLPLDVLKWFEKVYKHYLDWNRTIQYKIHLNSIWVNQMFEHEYNPVHVHQ